MSHPYKVNTYLDLGELWLLRELALQKDRSEAYILRDSLKRAGEADAVREPSADDLAALAQEVESKKKSREDEADPQ